MARPRNTTDSAHIRLRVDEDLRAALVAAAQSKGASLSSEIVARLRVSFFPAPMALNALSAWLGGAENTLLLLAVAQELRKAGDPSLPELFADPARCARICSAATQSTRPAAPAGAAGVDEAAA